MGLEAKREKLLAGLESLGSAVIGYSGGVDSALLCAAALRALGPDRMLACLADSPSLAGSEKRGALATAREAGFPVLMYSGSEMENPGYLRNGADRCYHCKGDLFHHLRRIAAEKGFANVLYGANADDAGDFRPGHRAARESGALAPLVEAGLTKEEIRTLAREWRLSCHDKPASPCLSSRIPYGQEVTPERLAQIEAGEQVLHGMGFEICRVRWDGGMARVEVEKNELHRLADPGRLEAITSRLRRVGFSGVSINPDGFRSGRLNAVLSEAQKRALSA